MMAPVPSCQVLTNFRGAHQKSERLGRPAVQVAFSAKLQLKDPSTGWVSGIQAVTFALGAGVSETQKPAPFLGQIAIY